KPTGQPHTPWRLLEHLRIAQWDILRFCVDPAHVSPTWTEGYWPSGDAPDATAWDRSVEAFRADLKAMRDLVADPDSDLFTPLPHGQGQTLLREARCCWPTTTPVTSASRPCAGAAWAPGKKRDRATCGRSHHRFALRRHRGAAAVPLLRSYRRAQALQESRKLTRWHVAVRVPAVADPHPSAGARLADE